MCQVCLDSLKEIFPEVPETERSDFLMGTTCFPFGDGEDTRAQLLDNRRRMTTADYRECYEIADRDMDEAMEGWRDDVAEPPAADGGVTEKPTLTGDTTVGRVDPRIDP